MNAPSHPALSLTRSELLRQAVPVAGRWVEPGTDPIAVSNPANGATLGHVPRLGREQVAEAVSAAGDAFPAWAARPAKERAKLLRRWFDLVMAHQEDLARIMTAEQGKPLKESRGEIAYAASFIEWFAEEGKRADGEVLQSPVPGRRLLVLRQPVGITAAITPWNFPAAMITRKAAPALAAGCPMIVKPASATPFSAIALAVLAEEAGIPLALLSIVTGPAREIAEAFTSDQRIRKLSFTGSTEVGRSLMASASRHIQRLSLELGGNAPFIVMDDADVEAAVEGAIASKFRNAGQTCVCANRIYAQSGIYEAFVSRLAARVADLRVGDGLAEGTEIGPLIDTAAVEKVEAHIADALAGGGTLLAGGKRHPLGGTFFQPTVVSGVGPQMAVAREETFGPFAPVFRFDTEEEAIAAANATEFGLAAYLYAKDAGRIFRIAEGLEYGIVGVNTGIISNEVSPFGGWKESGLGREGSRHGLDEYLEMKAIHIDL
ncbi:MAG: NAD-dependent succinate-semialdehyde dehydrogenase [Thermaurantiacus sp.]